jgi:predicted PurR-regulated permease PerM
MSAAPIEKSGAASGIMSTTRQIGSLLGIAVLGAVLQSRLISSVTNSLNNIPTITDELKAKITSTMSNGGFSRGMNLNGIPEEYSTDIMQMFYSGFANSLNTAMKVAVLFCIIGVLVSFLLPNKKKAPRN